VISIDYDKGFLEAMEVAAKEVQLAHDQMMELARDADAEIARLKASIRHAHRMFGFACVLIVFLLVWGWPGGWPLFSGVR
jgi:uncharacterized membrane protein YccC